MKSLSTNQINTRKHHLRLIKECNRYHTAYTMCLNFEVFLLEYFALCTHVQWNANIYIDCLFRCSLTSSSSSSSRYYCLSEPSILMLPMLIHFHFAYFARKIYCYSLVAFVYTICCACYCCVQQSRWFRLFEYTYIFTSIIR